MSHLRPNHLLLALCAIAVATCFAGHVAENRTATVMSLEELDKQLQVR